MKKPTNPNEALNLVFAMNKELCRELNNTDKLMEKRDPEMNHQMRLTFNNDRNICRSLFGLSKCRREESMQIKIAKKKKQSNSFAFRC